jgi:hypothetical protein
MNGIALTVLISQFGYAPGAPVSARLIEPSAC